MANTLPAGGADRGRGDLRDLIPGFHGRRGGPCTRRHGHLNIFTKLVLPASRLRQVVTGHVYLSALVGAAAVGVAVFAVAVVLLVLVFEQGHGPPRGGVRGQGDQRVHEALPQGADRRPGRPRRSSARRRSSWVSRRWLRLTWTTVLSHLAPFFVLLLAPEHGRVGAGGPPSRRSSRPRVQPAALVGADYPGGVGVIDLGHRRPVGLLPRTRRRRSSPACSSSGCSPTASRS